MHRPPTTDEFHNLILLRQALSVLGSEAPVQRALYPPHKDAETEMRALYQEALDRVRGVFWPAFAPRMQEGLLAVERALGAPGVCEPGALTTRDEWSQVRAWAREIAEWAPGAAVQAPRPWARQYVWSRGRLRERRTAQARESVADSDIETPKRAPG